MAFREVGLMQVSDYGRSAPSPTASAVDFSSTQALPQRLRRRPGLVR